MSFKSDEEPQTAWVKKLLLSEKFSDCSIWVKNSDSCTRFPGHKLILSTNSDVFAEALEKSSKEDEQVVIVQDMNPDAVVKVLEYMYLGQVQLEDWKLAAEVLEVVVKYKIPKLIDFCEDYLMNNINLQIVCYILQAAISNNSKKVENVCKKFCESFGFLVLNTGGFQKASLVIVEMILSDRNLRIENEMHVFRAAWKWATYKCCRDQKIVSDENVANEVQPLLHCIDFKSMSDEELKNVPETVKEKLSEFAPKNVEDKNISSAQIKRTQSVFVPEDLLRYFSSFTFDINHAETGRSNINFDLMRFSINACVYFVNIKIAYKLPLRIEGELCIRDSRKSLVFTSRKISLRFGPLSCSAAKIIILKAYEEYTIELKGHVNDSELFFTCPISSLECKQLDGVEITLLSEKCYGVSELTFAKVT